MGGRCEKFQLDFEFAESNISHLLESLHLRADPKQGLGDNLTLDRRSQSAKWRENVLSSDCGDLGSVSEVHAGDPGTNQSHRHCHIMGEVERFLQSFSSRTSALRQHSTFENIYFNKENISTFKDENILSTKIMSWKHAT